MVEHLRNMKELCRALHSDKDDRDMIVLRELLEWVLEQIIRLPAQERDLDLKGKILNDLYLLLERCEKRFFVKYSRHHAFSFFRLQRKPLKFSTSQSFAYQFEKRLLFCPSVLNRSAWTGSENFSRLSGKTCNSCAPRHGPSLSTEK